MSSSVPWSPRGGGSRWWDLEDLASGSWGVCRVPPSGPRCHLNMAPSPLLPRDCHLFAALSPGSAARAPQGRRAASPRGQDLGCPQEPRAASGPASKKLGPSGPHPHGSKSRQQPGGAAETLVPRSSPGSASAPSECSRRPSPHAPGLPGHRRGGIMGFYGSSCDLFLGNKRGAHCRAGFDPTLCARGTSKRGLLKRVRRKGRGTARGAEARKRERGQTRWNRDRNVVRRHRKK